MADTRAPILAACLAASALAGAGEVEIVAAWCAGMGGQAEAPLPEPAGPPTRVDCLTDTVAWEADRAHKWAEGIGQALYYARRTGRQPGVLLLIQQQSDARYLARLYRAADGLGVAVEISMVPAAE